MLTWVVPEPDSFAARCWLKFGSRKGEVAWGLVEVLLDNFPGELIREVELEAKTRILGSFQGDPDARLKVDAAWADLVSFNEVIDSSGLAVG